MNRLGLDDAALEARRKYIQAGDAARIMAGEWRQVYREKMGLAKGDDLSDELRVQMGLYTEPLNLAWCEKQTGREIEYFSGNALANATWYALTNKDAHWIELQVSPDYPFMACNLDGMTTTAQGHRCPIDAKHVGTAGDPMILRYTAAGTHQATVMRCDWWALSVFIGNGKWELIEQEVDPFYQADLIARCREFWGYVERGEEPEDRGDAVLPPKPQPKLRIVQLEDEFRDAWPNWGGEMLPLIETFAATDAAAKLNGLTRDKIKELLPPDVGTVTRGLFKAHRDKAGAVRISLAKGKED